MKQLRIVLLLLCAAVMTGCSRKEHPAQVYAPDDSRRLVIYTSHQPNIYEPIVREFEEQTGIWVEVVTGGSLELLEQLRTQEITDADVLFGGGADSLEAYSDCFQSYASPACAHVPQGFRDDNDRWTPFSVLPVVLIYNSKLVDPGMLTGWQDLFRPEFRGQIAFADPEKSGSCFTALSTFQNAVGADALETLAQSLGGVQLDSSGSIPVKVASGECLVGITLEETALKKIRDGANLSIVYPEDGTSCVPDGTAILRNAPHPENAQKFLDFTLSTEVQQILITQMNRRSVLVSLADTEALPSLDSLNVLPYDLHAAAENRPSLLRSWSAAMKGAR